MTALLIAKPMVTTAVVQETPKEPVVLVEVIQSTVPEKCADYLPEIAKYDWDFRVASEIMYAESGCNPSAVNRTDNHKRCLGSYGLFQISCTTSTTMDPAENVRLAYEEKYLKGGWKHWSVCKSRKLANGTVLKPLVKCW